MGPAPLVRAVGDRAAGTPVEPSASSQGMKAAAAELQFEVAARLRCAPVRNCVASNTPRPNGVGIDTRNGTRTDVPAIGTSRSSMSRNSARYLIVARLGIPAADLVRRSEEIYKTQYVGKTLTEAQWLDALAAHPILIERPIAVRGDRAVIGRPPERVLELL